MKLAAYKLISKEINAEITAVLAKHGLSVPRGISARIDEHLGVVRLSIEATDTNHKDASGEATNPERELYKQQGFIYGLKPEWLGTEILSAGRPMTIVGLKARSAKNPVIIADQAGKRFVTSVDAILTYFALRGDADAKQRLARGY